MEQFNLQNAILIKADGETKELKPNSGKRFTYEEVYRAIGNCIELIDLLYFTNDKNYKKMLFICDEEGAINSSKLNKKASQLLKEILGPTAQDLYGNVIFLPRKLF